MNSASIKSAHFGPRKNTSKFSKWKIRSWSFCKVAAHCTGDLNAGKFSSLSWIHHVSHKGTATTSKRSSVSSTTTTIHPLVRGVGSTWPKQRSRKTCKETQLGKSPFFPAMTRHWIRSWLVTPGSAWTSLLFGSSYYYSGISGAHLTSQPWTVAWWQKALGKILS